MASRIKRRPTDRIIGLGLITAEAIASELRQRLMRRLTYRRLPDQQLTILARQTLAEFEPILARNIAFTDLAAWIAGLNEVAKELPPDVLATYRRMMGGPPRPPRPPGGLILPPFGDEPDPEPIVRFPMIERAADKLLNLNILRPEEYRQADAATRANAFTVAGDLSRDTLETIRDVLGETVADGASLKVFRENLGPRLEKSFIGPGHLETVFRTNVQAAFHDGHDALASDPIVTELFPYQAYLPIHDGRVEAEHLALGDYSPELGIGPLGIDGTGVYRRDDPFWDVFTPPWRWNCRCGINLLTIEAAARAGVREAEQWLRTGVRPPLVSRLPHIPFRPPVGFGQRRRVAA